MRIQEPSRISWAQRWGWGERGRLQVNKYSSLKGAVLEVWANSWGQSYRESLTLELDLEKWVSQAWGTGGACQLDGGSAGRCILGNGNSSSTEFEVCLCANSSQWPQPKFRWEIMGYEPGVVNVCKDSQADESGFYSVSLQLLNLFFFLSSKIFF